VNAGIPGTGLGGIYYLTAAIFLPIRTVVRAGRFGFKTRLGRALGQATIAALVFGGIWATGWLLGLVFGPVVTTGFAGDRHFFEHHRGNLIRWAVFLAGYVTLAMIMAAVQVAKLMVRRQRAAERKTLHAATADTTRVVRPRSRAANGGEEPAQKLV
jgi:hypothetical protein